MLYLIQFKLVNYITFIFKKFNHISKYKINWILTIFKNKIPNC